MTIAIEEEYENKDVILQLDAHGQPIWRYFRGLSSLRGYWQELPIVVNKTTSMRVVPYLDRRGYVQHAYVESVEIFALPPAHSCIVRGRIGVMTVEGRFYPEPATDA